MRSLLDPVGRPGNSSLCSPPLLCYFLGPVCFEEILFVGHMGVVESVAVAVVHVVDFVVDFSEVLYGYAPTEFFHPWEQSWRKVRR